MCVVNVSAKMEPLAMGNYYLGTRYLQDEEEAEATAEEGKEGGGLKR